MEEDLKTTDATAESAQAQAADGTGCAFKVSSKLGEKEYADYQRYCSRKLVLAVHIILTALFLGLGAVYCTMEENLATGVVFIVIGVLFAVFYPFFYKKQLIKNRSAFVGNNMLNLAEFSDYGITERTLRGEEQVGVTSVKYSDVVKVAENKEVFYLFISRLQAFIVCKDGFLIGDVKEFPAFLRSKGIKVIELKNKKDR